MAPLKVLIVGGGISGPALGYWLSKLDCDITIVERSPDLRASGQQIDIRGQGLTAMRRMGLEPAVREKVVHEHGLKFIDERGNVKALFEANLSGKGRQSFTAEFEIMRGDLVRILYAATKEKCTYIFGTTIEDFEQHGDGVHVKLSNGTEGDFDLLVGADGQNSKTRRKLRGPDQDDAFHDLKLFISYFTVPKTEKDENYARVLLLPRRRLIATRVDNPKTMQVYLGILDPNDELTELEEAMKSGDAKKQKQIYADQFRGAGWEVPRLMEGMLHSTEADDFYSQKVGQVKMSNWAKGRVVLLGDAGYCASPVSGIGTSLGLVGPYVLAGEISRQLNHQQQSGSATSQDHGRAIDVALESYEAVFRPFVTQCQKLRPGVPSMAYADGEWGVWLRQVVLGLISTLRLHKLIERFSSDEFGGGWKLPDYPELKYEYGSTTGAMNGLNHQ
ncbi:FAD/NAD(P)-binding domain-containing protein [Cryphonectria parasitica EP155]|uniref:FAD/NAD(P)-binding domain-containing protein n=1 Tax=Cryphonectria parasitica (strain ATCC 38755 / EP155) TaxID=660469 RepID=A0A9P4XSS0_CRYP1|nr:FAD/NAD(P)-binding domain-containing protein [Cryphonectria parasitica EP155]KAF3760289.1 FAD/NAD(P)-binding domain-containing protein [Cryphonectria parasitica EP155]